MLSSQGASAAGESEAPNSSGAAPENGLGTPLHRGYVSLAVRLAYQASRAASAIGSPVGWVDTKSARHVRRPEGWLS